MFRHLHHELFPAPYSISGPTVAMELIITSPRPFKLTHVPLEPFRLDHRLVNPDR
jgi:hypothetical protein